MSLCETCIHWRSYDCVRDARHKRGLCLSKDARVPSGGGHGSLVTWADFGCVAHEGASAPHLDRPTGKLRLLKSAGEERLQQEIATASGNAWVDVPVVKERKLHLGH